MKVDTDTLNNLNAARIVAAGQDAIRAGDLVIDFSTVVHCDTAAVACILAWLRSAQAAGKTLQFLAIPRDLVSLATLYGVQELIPDH